MRKLVGRPSEKIVVEPPRINVICMPIIGEIGFWAKDDIGLDLIDPLEEKREMFSIKLHESIDDVRKVNFGVGYTVNRCRFQQLVFSDTGKLGTFPLIFKNTEFTCCEGQNFHFFVILSKMVKKIGTTKRQIIRMGTNK